MKKNVSLFLALLLALTVFFAVPQTAEAGVVYHSAGALAYAREHWDDEQGLGAEFVSRCVMAGGLNVGIRTNMEQLWPILESKSGLKSQRLVLRSDGYVYQTENRDFLKAGDVVYQWCDTHVSAASMMICGGFDDKGRATVYAHDSAVGNKAYPLGKTLACGHTGSCRIVAKVIHLTDLDAAVAAGPVSMPSYFAEPTDPAYQAMAEVGDINATVVVRICKPFGAKCSEVGVSLCDASGMVIKRYSKDFSNVPAASEEFSCWFDFKKDLSITLRPSTHYLYSFFVLLDGKEYVSKVYNLTTRAIPPDRTGTVAIQRITECGYQVEITKDNTSFQWCDTPDSAYVNGSTWLNAGEESFFATQRLDMSDGSVRYYYVNQYSGKGRYLIYNRERMSAVVRHNYTMESTEDHPHQVTEYCACGSSRIQANSSFDPNCEECSPSYLVTFHANGGMTTSGAKQVHRGAAYGTLPTAVWEGYVFDGWYTDEYGGTKITAATVSSLTEDQTLYAHWVADSPDGKGDFIDVPSSAYYANAVSWAVENGITSGTGGGRFRPLDSCTRAQAVTFLWRAAGSPEPESEENPFLDVKEGAYYYKAVLWAVEQNITAGTSVDSFSPNGNCTRGQIVCFLHRAAGAPVIGAGSAFSDVRPGAYYENAVGWAVEKGITAGTGDGKFSPGMACSRAQIVTFLYRNRTEPQLV